MKGLYKYSNSANWWFHYTPGRGKKRKQVGLKTPDEAIAITRARAILAEAGVPEKSETPKKGPLESVIVNNFKSKSIQEPFRPFIVELTNGKQIRITGEYL